VDASGRWAAIAVAGATLKMRHCDRGSFTLGSPTDEVGRHDDEDGAEVRITRGFWICETETSQAAYQGLIGANPSAFHGDELPVDSVTWDEARAFCRALSARIGGTARLPSEAEWEYACRAGDAQPFAGDGPQATCWSRETAGGSSHPVGMLAANRWGLRDMHGNVMEWCEDEYAPYPTRATDDRRGVGGTLRVARGGAWCSAASDCRSASRARYLPGSRYFFLGFRVLVEDSQ
jgi:formylglycine-generating enzyme required for sulfatase activity